MGGFEDVPAQTKSGRVITVATLKINPGKEAYFEELITTTKNHALSDKEPGTFTYRTTRVLDKNGKPTGEYIIFEEYAGKAGFQEHAAQPPLQAIMAEKDVIASINLEFADEF
ncbi:hypothetical protein K435DRAFT_777644 [Dendrothele bispora CBS 962.96]|uniref:ABM domain-containing protein n=1 Tax=Dendrothele bispora (strain CBS 962.96) TaxID=1314807 RepID=A0A4S8M763_DENBC|nr:hypothetical protein K435DRAFT_777644 [Dendrothele bispora CBS 962.96]